MVQFVYKHTPAAVGVLLLYTGIYKLIYPGEAISALIALEIAHQGAIFIVAVITMLELYLGTILLLKVDLKYGLVMATGLLFVFALFLCFLVTMANPPACGCMGLTAIFRSNRQNALIGLLRNCVILWLLKGAYDYYFPRAASP